MRQTIRAGVLALVVALAAAAPAAATPKAPPISDAVVAKDVVTMTASELSRLLQNRSVTSAQLVDAYLKRIDAYEDAYGDQPGVNAIITVNPKARAEARALDRERAKGAFRGPLHGIPVLVKDNYDTWDLPTTNGSLALEGTRPPDDATQVARLRKAGAIVIAKTNLHEYAYGITSISSLGGQTRNPYDQTRNPGGSSGGTGAGLAASFGAVGMGSDTCGSIRIPAAQNGLVGLRPTLGLASRDGIMPMSATQDVGGPIAKSVEDIAMVLDATVGLDLADPITAASTGLVPKSYLTGLSTKALEGKRIGIVTDLLGTSAAEQPTTDLVRKAAADMAAQGATVVELGALPQLAALLSGSGVIGDEFERDLNRYLAQPGIVFPDGLAALAAPADKVTLADIVASGKVTPTVLSILTRLVANPVTSDTYQQHLLARAQLQAAVRELFTANTLDAVLYPTIKQVAVPVGESQPGSNCAMSANTGFPALSLPAGRTAGGMPVGVELLGLPFTEPGLLSMGYDYEQATKHRTPPASTPPLAG
jgi:amidase